MTHPESLARLLSSVPGLDAAEARERFEGMEELLERLLRRFHADHQDFLARLYALLRNGPHDEAIRLVHSLKGVSGNLALNPVFHAAAGLERALRHAAGEVPGQVEVLRAALEAALAGLARGLAEQGSAVVVVASHAMPREELAARLERLAQGLAEADPGAHDQATALEGPLMAAGLGGDARGLVEATGAYDMARAAELVTALRAKV